MMDNTLYRISDEPAPGPLAHLAVNPLWPFVAIMFSGSLLSWGWFILNSIAVGSPTRQREWLWAAAGFVVSALLLMVLLYFADAQLLTKGQLKYAFLLLVVWKLGITYMLYSLQSHTIELYEYYGGVLRNGIPVLLVAYVVSPKLMAALPSYLRLWLS